MALLLSDAQKLTNDVILQGIYENIVTESAVLQMLPFEEVNGTAIIYNQEASLGGSSWYAVGDTWTEGALSVTQKAATLKILGGDVDVDSFLQTTYKNPNDLRAMAIASKSKSVAYSFNDAFFNGNSATNAKQFDGVGRLVTSGQTRSLGTNGAAPTLDDYDALIDMVKPGKPDALFMSRRTRRGLKKLRRGQVAVIEQAVNEFGQRIDTYDGIPVIVDDNLSDALTQGSATNASVVYAVQFGVGRGLVGLTNGWVQYTDIGELETKDAMRMRVRWYCGLMNSRDLAVAAMTGVLPN